MERSGYILGGMSLLTQYAETQKTNIYWTFVYIRSGVGMYILDSDLRALNEGDIIILPPRIAYSFCATELGDEYNVSVDAVILRFDDSWLTTLLSVFKTLNGVILKVRELKDPYSIEGPKWMKMSTLFNSLSSDNSSRVPVYLIEILELLSTRQDLVRILQATPCDAMTLEEKKERIEAYISSNIYSKVSLEEVSAYLGMNRTYFCSFFRRIYRKGFVDYINDLRVEKACTMLAQSGMQISDIARECGFKTAPYFTRAFRRSRGMSPAEFRKKALNR